MILIDFGKGQEVLSDVRLERNVNQKRYSRIYGCLATHGTHGVDATRCMWSGDMKRIYECQPTPMSLALREPLPQPGGVHAAPIDASLRLDCRSCSR